MAVLPAINRLDVVNVSQLIARGGTRRFLSVYNEGATNLFLALAPTCTSTVYTVRLLPNEFFELPGDSSANSMYQGPVSVIRNGTDTGAALVTVQE